MIKLIKNEGDFKMEKIEKPKRFGQLEKLHSFDLLIDGDPYVEDGFFDGETVSFLSIDRLTLNKCHFKNMIFESCNFERIDLMDTIFENCDLSHLKMMDGIIHRCEFRNCRMTGSDLSNCAIQQTLFEENTARYANFSFSKFKKVNFIKNQLMNTSFNECQFNKVCYKENDLSESEFINTKLSGLNFSTCDIHNTIIPVDSLKGLTVSSEQAIQLAKLLGVNIV